MVPGKMVTICSKRRIVMTLAILVVIVLVRLVLVDERNDRQRPVFVITPRVHSVQQHRQTTGRELHTQLGMEAPPERVWHLDLKGGAPKIPVIEGVMGLARQAGATALLIEWEDMFPFDGPLANMSAHNAYSREDVTRLVEAAKTNDLQLIHLMQCLGHLEYALKLPQWADLREGDSPADGCPSRPGTAQLVTAAIDQLMSAAPTSLIHIGADEVYTLGTCKLCKARNAAPLQLYVEHVMKVARHVKSQWGARVLIWDDMLRRAPSTLLHSLAGLVEPTVWAYGPDVTRMVPPHILRTYAAIFPRVWVAPAFKGATGPRAIIPDASRHAANTLAWVQISQKMRSYSGLSVAGIVITGWSRYDHFAVLCELLPPSMPSLVLSLLLASRGYMTQATLHDVHTILDCPSHVVIDPARDPHLWACRNCAFPGANVVSLLHNYATLKDSIKQMVKRGEENGGWLTQYNDDHNFSPPMRIRDATAELKKFVFALSDLQEEASGVLSQYHNPPTVSEWIEQNLKPLNMTLTRISQRAEKLLTYKTWPRRPLEWLQRTPEAR